MHRGLKKKEKEAVSGGRDLKSLLPQRLRQEDDEFKASCTKSESKANLSSMVRFLSQNEWKER